MSQKPDRIILSPHEMAMGMSFESQISAAKARVEAALTAQQMFVAHLRTMHNAPADQYQLQDWAEGFTQIKEKEKDNG
ncbi:MAG TPA: hypothetical protein PL105_01880 [Caldilineaceae bacterium]|nr:hypothetical protein [Caldilineaceae bacterium]